MNFHIVATARRELSEICCLCLSFIAPGQVYVRAEAKTAHYKCAKENCWKQAAPRKRKILPRIKRERVNKLIKVVRKGKTIKQIPT